MGRSATALAAILLLAAPAAGGTDLAAAYPECLESAGTPVAWSWSMRPSDVHRLSSFRLERAEGMLLAACGPATLVVGHHDGAALLAVVLPDSPGTLAASSREWAFTSLYLRFHPTLVGNLFPAETVEGPGPAKALLAARRIAGAKMGGSFQMDDLPVVPPPEAMILDAETPGPKRVFVIHDAAARTIRVVDAFAGRFLPPAPAEPMGKEEALAAFDATWQAFDAEYAMFGRKQDVDWAAARDLYRPIAAQAETAWEAAAAIALLVAELRDLHAWVRLGEEFLPGWNRPRPGNGNYRAGLALVGPPEEAGPDLAFARTADGIGYAVVWRLSDAELPARFDATLAKLGDVRGLVLDLRYNGGGNEALAQAIAGRFAAERTVYAASRYRAGPGHDDLTEPFPRYVEPRGPSRFGKPVVVLQGRRTMSSAESFAAMMSVCPGVTIMGDRTAGSSGNPRLLSLPGGISVNLPRWLDLGPDGAPLDEVGLPPDVPVDAPFDQLRNGDPVLARALALIREG